MHLLPKLAPLLVGEIGKPPIEPRPLDRAPELRGDLRHDRQGRFVDLEAPVGEYVEQRHRPAPHEHGQDER